MDHYNISGEIPIKPDESLYYSYTVPEGFILPRGKYAFYLYGSPGAGYTEKDGAGAYIRAEIDLRYIKHEILMYPCVYNGDFGGGGTGSYSGSAGGGSTDIRLVLDNENASQYSVESRCSRILVAAGGGGMPGRTRYQYKNTSGTSYSGYTAYTYGGKHQQTAPASAVSNSNYTDTLSYGGTGAYAYSGGTGGTTKAPSSITGGTSVQIFQMGGGGGGGGGYFCGGGGAGASAILKSSGRLLGVSGSSGSFQYGGRGGNAAKTGTYTYATLGSSSSDYGRWCGGAGGGGGSNYISGVTAYTCEWNGTGYGIVNEPHSSGLVFTNANIWDATAVRTYGVRIYCLELFCTKSIFISKKKK